MCLLSLKNLFFHGHIYYTNNAGLYVVSCSCISSGLFHILNACFYDLI